jgi:hypothetical protein
MRRIELSECLRKARAVLFCLLLLTGLALGQDKKRITDEPLFWIARATNAADMIISTKLDGKWRPDPQPGHPFRIRRLCERNPLFRNSDCSFNAGRRLAFEAAKIGGEFLAYRFNPRFAKAVMAIDAGVGAVGFTVNLRLVF